VKSQIIDNINIDNNVSYM